MCSRVPEQPVVEKTELLNDPQIAQGGPFHVPSGMLRNAIFTAILALSLAGAVQAQELPTVVNTYEYAPGRSHYPYDMEVNAMGDVWLMGLALGDTVVPRLGLLVKFSDHGQTLDWAHQYADVGMGGDVDIDPEGNAHIAATVYDSIGDTRSNYLVQKLAADGAVLWSRTWTGSGENSLDRASSLCVDSEGNVIVTGVSESPAYTGFRWVTVKYGPTGDTLWVAEHIPPSNVANVAGGFDIATDAADNIYVTGESTDDVNGHFTTIKYAADGTERWLRREGGGYYSRGLCVRVNGDMVAVAGHYTHGELDSTDMFIARYDTAGNTAWTALYDAPHPTVTTPINGRETVADLALNADGSVIVAGTQFTTNGSSNDYTVVKFDATGEVVWGDHYGPGTGWSDARSLFVDASGSVVVTGMCEGTATGLSEIRTVKYTADGILAWEAPYTPDFMDRCHEGIIRWDGVDHFYVGASSNSTAHTQLLLLGYAIDTAVPDVLHQPSATVYPNPAHGTTTLQHAGGQHWTAYALYDPTGRMVRTGRSSGSTYTNIDLLGLAPGNYTVHLKQEEHVEHLQLMVE